MSSKDFPPGYIPRVGTRLFWLEDDDGGAGSPTELLHDSADAGADGLSKLSLRSGVVKDYPYTEAEKGKFFWVLTNDGVHQKVYRSWLVDPNAFFGTAALAGTAEAGIVPKETAERKISKHVEEAAAQFLAGFNSMPVGPPAGFSVPPSLSKAKAMEYRMLQDAVVRASMDVFLARSNQGVLTRTLEVVFYPACKNLFWFEWNNGLR